MSALCVIVVINTLFLDVPKAIHITNMLGISNVPDYYTCAGCEDIHTAFMVHFCLHNIIVMFMLWVSKMYQDNTIVS